MAVHLSIRCMELYLYIPQPANTYLVLWCCIIISTYFRKCSGTKGGWIQNRANTLAIWCMFAQVFPLFQVGTRFAVLPVLYGTDWTNGLELSTAAQPTYANPTAQGVMAILAIVVNVLCITIIIKRSVEQKKNPYKNEIFTDQKDFRLLWQELKSSKKNRKL